jgi:ferrochelatase
MAYGTPRSLDEVERYYTHIRRGRPPAPEELADLVRRYQAIGGVSPLTAITMRQAQGLEALLNADGGRPCRVYLGMKHTEPFIADAVAQMAADGVEEAVTLVLAPHYSTMSVAAYQQAAESARTQCGGPRLWHIDHWHLQPRFLRALAQRVETALRRFPDPQQVTVVFTAHSLPERILAAGDPYPRQLRETGEAVARQLGLRHVRFGWQSAGRTAERWLGPDILELLHELQAEGVRDVLVCPAGFVSDHLEVLYDLDIEARHVAESLGLRFERTASLNDDPEFLRALAEVVRHRERQALEAERRTGHE